MFLNQQELKCYTIAPSIVLGVIGAYGVVT
jgi:hypothetical protein